MVDLKVQTKDRRESVNIKVRKGQILNCHIYLNGLALMLVLFERVDGLIIVPRMFSEEH